MRALAVIALLTATAHADSKVAQAEAMFREGRALLDKGLIEKACLAFEASQKLAPAITTQLNIASCREKNSELATAWGVFLEIERATRDATDDANKQFHKTAAERAAKLEPKLSKLTINVEHPVPGLVVTRGNVTVDASLWAHRLPVDGGRVAIEAAAPKYDHWYKLIDIDIENGETTVDIPRLQWRGAKIRTPRRDGDDDDEPEPKAHGSTLPALAAGIGAAALFGGAIGFELWGESIYDEANAEFDRATQDELWDQANTRRYAAEGFAIAGAGLVTLAIYLYLESR